MCMVILVLPILGRDCNVDAGRCILAPVADSVGYLRADDIGFVVVALGIGNAFRIRPAFLSPIPVVVLGIARDSRERTRWILPGCKLSASLTEILGDRRWLRKTSVWLASRLSSSCPG